jgi:hypothetical protein
MSELPDPSWRHLGSTSNADVYEIASDVIGVLPQVAASDTEASARESIDFQAKHWAAVGHRGGTVVFMDRVLQQDGAARAVYANETTGHPTTCFALVGESFFAMAVSSVFMGLAKPGPPTMIFKTLAEALPWIAEHNHEAAP